MPRPAANLCLSDSERQTLEGWAKRGIGGHRQAERARIVLAAAAGKRTDVIARELRTRPARVSRWRQRFAQAGLAGLADAPRRGRRGPATTSGQALRPPRQPNRPLESGGRNISAPPHAGQTPAPVPRQILLIVPMDIETGRGILRGVRHYAAEHANWVFRVVYPHHLNLAAVAAAAHVDGIIAHLHSRRLATAVRSLHKPTVNVSNVIGDDLGVPRIGSDDLRIGRGAAEYFLERGFCHFAFFGYPDFAHSRLREQGFRERLAGAGHACSAFEGRAPRRLGLGEPWAGVDERVRPWLRALPRPVAIFTPSAIRGFEMLEICRQEGLVVPHEAAVLGVDNDEVICGLATPPLSALRVANERIGFEAGALLDRLLQGKPAPAGPILLQPGEVVTRQSTDILAVHDPALERALRFVRANLQRPIRVEEVASAAAVSRRVLEQRFRSVVGLSSLQEIRRLRLELARRLLSETHLPMPAVAARCGVGTPQRLAKLFRQQLGCSPTAYRHSLRGTTHPTRTDP